MSDRITRRIRNVSLVIATRSVFVQVTIFHLWFPVRITPNMTLLLFESFTVIRILKGRGTKLRAVSTDIDGSYEGQRQECLGGSFIAVAELRLALEGMESFTVQAMAWPTTPEEGLPVNSVTLE